MTGGIIKHSFFACFVTGVLLLLGDQQISGQRRCCEGEQWLTWNSKARETYVYGYAVGYGHGHRDGCFQGTKGWPEKGRLAVEDDPTAKCLKQQLDFSRGTDYFAQAVTDFYKRYPGDRDLYIDEVLEQLGKGQSLEQIHNYPFNRRVSLAK
jgi:hypothetical protein